MIVRAAWTLLPSGVVPDVAVELDGSRINSVRPAVASDPPPLDGLLIPGLVNAHAHVELSHLAGRIPATGAGFPEWAGRLTAARSAPDPAAVRAAAHALHACGTAIVADVSNGGDTASILTDAGLAGIVQHEVLGFGARTLDARIAATEAIDRLEGAFVVRPAAHAIYSTPPALLRAALAPRLAPGTIHLAEDPAEAAFLRGEGPWPAILDRMGVDWRWWTPPGLSPAAYLESVGVLRPDVLLVHGVWLDAAARALVARAGAPLALCPRSNLHIGGRLPDVPALIQAGVRLALGTDSLASNADLDLLGEIPPLAAAFPGIDPIVWLRLATEGGADALGMPRHGRIVAGATPGLLLLEGVRAAGDPLSGAGRRWLAPAGSPW